MSNARVALNDRREAILVYFKLLSPHLRGVTEVKIISQNDGRESKLMPFE